MAELVCLTALGVVSLFTGIVSLGNSDAFMGMFTFMILLVSYALIILTFRKQKKLFIQDMKFICIYYHMLF